MKIEWMNEANCKKKTNLFYIALDETATQRRKREALAKAICKSCSVIGPCRDYARANNELGIWGGETEEERFFGGYLNSPVVNKRLARMRRRLER